MGQHMTNEPFEIPGIVRVEKAKPYRKAVATEDLLRNDRTAEHYQVGAFDSLGKPIVLGDEMTYVDWLNRSDVCWRVYEWQAVEAGAVAKWVPVADFATRDEAVNSAESRAVSHRQAGA